MRQLFFLLLILALLAATVWGVGFVWFIGQVPMQSLDTAKNKEKASIGIVLTGAQGRIMHGLILLYEKRIDQLFISGVNENVTDAELFASADPTPTGKKLAQRLYQQFHGEIFVGRKAHSTRSNALEVKDFLAERGGNHTLMLITTNYHMPRSLMEFEHALPDHKIIAEPVFSPQFGSDWWQHEDSISLLINEYHKTIISWALKFFKRETRYRELLENYSL